MKKLLISLIIFITSVTHAAVETEITVLGLYLSDADTVKARTYFDKIQEYWPMAGGITIKLKNAGIPQLLVSSTAGDYFARIVAATTAIHNSGVRDGADVVMVFTGADYNNVCGLALQWNWTFLGGSKPGFLPIQGIDTAGKDDGYVGLVGTKGGCTSDDLGAHEFGHLFGAGHMDQVGSTFWLYGTSHATINGGTTSSIMQGNYLLPYPRANTFSNNATGPANNLHTLGVTAKSVANYRTSCSLSVPTNVYGTRMGCYGSYTEFSISWSDSCPGESVYYQLYKEQPVGSGYVFGASTLPPIITAYVRGVPANAAAKACSVSSCSALSSSEALLIPDCNW